MECFLILFYKTRNEMKDIYVCVSMCLCMYILFYIQIFALWLVHRGENGFNDRRRVVSNLTDNVYK